MSNLNPHPEEAALLRLIDGELAPAEAREIERHMAACPECRLEVEELRETLGDCRRYREEVLGTMLPAPPKPWAELRTGFARIDAGEDAETWGKPFGLPRQTETRPRRLLQRPSVRWALAAAAMLTFAIVWQFRETPSVQAASLLHKAEIAAAKRPASAVRRVLFRTRSAQFTRVVGRTTSLPQEPKAPALEALFQSAHWNWNDPLSAQAFADWRNSLNGHETDSVNTTAGAYQIRTRTTEGELAAASITLRSADFEPVEARLEFRNQEWVELSEAAEPLPEEPGVVVPRATPAPAPAAAPAPTLPTPPRAPPALTVGGTLQVLGALHDIGADLGEQVEVNPVDGRLVVSGLGIPAARQKQIQAALEKFPNVTVHFAEPSNAPPVSAPAPDAGSAPGENAPSGVAGRVERQLGGRPQFERFSSQMLDWNDQAMAQAYALRRLAERFPASTEASFSPADRRALRRIARDNATALDGVTAKMVRTLDPVLAALGGQAAPSNAPAALAWQTAAEDLLATAQRVERRLSVTLGAASSADAPFSPADLRADLKRLQDDLGECRRLLAQE